MDGVIAEEEDARRSYCDTVRSADAANALFPEDVRAISRNGFDEAVCRH